MELPDTNHVRYCPHCKEERRGEMRAHNSIHRREFFCYSCMGKHFPGKDESDPTKHRRPNQHKELVAKYSKGYCELCLRSEMTIKKRGTETMEAHHIIPFQHGGSHERENIWILCTACHRQVEHYRTYYNDATSIKVFIEAMMQKGKDQAA